MYQVSESEAQDIRLLKGWSRDELCHWLLKSFATGRAYPLSLSPHPDLYEQLAALVEIADDRDLTDEVRRAVVIAASAWREKFDPPVSMTRFAWFSHRIGATAFPSVLKVLEARYRDCRLGPESTDAQLSQAGWLLSVIGGSGPDELVTRLLDSLLSDETTDARMVGLITLGLCHSEREMWPEWVDRMLLIVKASSSEFDGFDVRAVMHKLASYVGLREINRQIREEDDWERTQRLVQVLMEDRATFCANAVEGRILLDWAGGDARAALPENAEGLTTGEILLQHASFQYFDDAQLVDLRDNVLEEISI